MKYRKWSGSSLKFNMQSRAGRCAVGLLGASLLSLGVGVCADTPRVNHIKAAFILNIARFVTWPALAYRGGHDHLLFCHYGVDSLGEAGASIEGRKVANRRLRLTIIKDLSAIGRCSILLIPYSELPRYAEDIGAGFSRPVLTIADLTDTDVSDVAFDGVVVNLIRKSSTIGFEINVEQTARSGLRMSSEILKLAHLLHSDHRL